MLLMEMKTKYLLIIGIEAKIIKRMILEQKWKPKTQKELISIILLWTHNKKILK